MHDDDSTKSIAVRSDFYLTFDLFYRPQLLFNMEQAIYNNKCYKEESFNIYLGHQIALKLELLIL
ncbi:hypothetical protein OTSTA716_0470 [Orientia tsutsugamushi str. TA716]|uniref:Uncharacterized protein n=1 Tax=Orientia tsutsugamushi str. TA716 TaxID=1359175 RepID=A0A0F3P9J0_ORITS|nr:hypothetical protein OTSTA716_0470 [Orientia tsutsugamushi str. TA716]